MKHYDLPLESLALTKAHRAVEGEHRKAAWRALLGHVAADERKPVADAVGEAVVFWHAYRDAVADACGVTRDNPALTA